MADPPTPTWPAVDGDKGHTSIDHDRVKSFLKALDDDLKRYQGQATYNGTPDGLNSALGDITMESVGGGGSGKSGYPGGKLFFDSVQKTKAGFYTEYNNFLTEYQQVVEALYQAAGIRQDADTSSAPKATATSQQPSGSQGSYDSGSTT